MKNLKRVCLALVVTAFLSSCEKPSEPVLETPTGETQSYKFLSEGFVYTLGELENPDSSVYESYERHTVHLMEDSAFYVQVHITTDQDTSVHEEDAYSGEIVNGMLILEGYPYSVLNAQMNKVYTYGNKTITKVAQNISVSTPKGTFTCDRFEITENGQKESVSLVDNKNQYPFIKLGEYSETDSLPRFYFELLPNK